MELSNGFIANAASRELSEFDFMQPIDGGFRVGQHSLCLDETALDLPMLDDPHLYLPVLLLDGTIKYQLLTASESRHEIVGKWDEAAFRLHSPAGYFTKLVASKDADRALNTPCGSFDRCKSGKVFRLVIKGNGSLDSFREFVRGRIRLLEREWR
jgi:hypothetical protein